MATQAAAPSAGEHAVRKPYVLVFAFLAIITVVEVLIPTYGAQVGLQKNEQVIFLISTAAAKASLVALYYMHLRYEPAVLRYIPFVPLGLVAILVLTLVV